MTQISTSRAFGKAREAWLTELRSACLVLSEKPERVVSAVSVTQRFLELDAPEREALVSLANNLAGEYGLGATVVDNGTWLTARVAHVTGGSAPVAETPKQVEPVNAAQPRRRGILGALLAHIRPSPVAVDRWVEAAVMAESLENS